MTASLALAPAPLGLAAAHLDQTFATHRAQGRAVLAAYLPVGYPTLDRSLMALHALAEHAEILELGLPFSDPILDGPVIQAAGAQSLAAGFRIKDLLLATRELAASSADLLVMTYWQPLSRYGPERFAQLLAEAGGAGVILPDLPVQEAGRWLAAAQTTGLHTIFVVAPNASDSRLARVCAAGSGMLYAPAVAGVTGSTGPLHIGLPGFVHRLRALTSLPVGVGIGVSNAAQAHAISGYADAVIVGSALIRRLQEAPGPAGVRAAAALAAELSAGLRQEARAPMEPAACRLTPNSRPPRRPAHHAGVSGGGRKAEAVTTRFETAPADATGVLEQNRALAEFVRERLVEVDGYGCGAERKAFAGAWSVLIEFEAKHPRLDQLRDNDFFVAQIDTMRWVLCCVAAGSFSRHPDFRPAFRPPVPVLAQPVEVC